jgi:hypothetical protein
LYIVADLVVELPPSIYERLKEEAARLGKPPQVLAQEWIAEKLQPDTTPAATHNRESVRRALQAAGLLTEVSPGLQKLADASISLQEVQDILRRAGGTPLSQIVIEQRESHN